MGLRKLVSIKWEGRVDACLAGSHFVLFVIAENGRAAGRQCWRATLLVAGRAPEKKTGPEEAVFKSRWCQDFLHPVLCLARDRSVNPAGLG